MHWINTLSVHTDAVDSASFSPDGTKIVTASKDRIAKIWDLCVLMPEKMAVFCAARSED